ncbi:MAG: hypothetical protein H3Z53_12365 [archaeon]|nr:hypothetical protein [archaeon]MCP8315143.1 hypothetical protein [archaeon]
MSSVELIAKLKAVDEASDKIKQIGDKTEEAMKKVEDSTKKADFSFKQFTISVSGVMTAGFNLYNMYNRVTDAQRNVEKAQYSLKQAQDAAKGSQDAYTNAVNRFGTDSPQAVTALDNLKDAQEKVRLKSEELKDKQDRVTESMVYCFVTLGPTIITGIKNMKDAITELNATLGVSGLAGAASTAGTALAAIATVLAGGAMIYGAYVDSQNEVSMAFKQMGVYCKGGQLALKLYHEELNQLNQDVIQLQQAETIMEGAALSMDELSLTLTDLALSNEQVQTASQETITALTGVDEALGALSGSVGSMSGAFGEAFASISGMINEWASTTKAAIDDVVGAFESASQEIAGGSIWPDMWADILSQTKKGMRENIRELDRGLDKVEDMLSRPMYMDFRINIDVSGLRAQIANMIKSMLKSVTIEKTSAQATTSRIRVPTTTTTTTPRSPILGR